MVASPKMRLTLDVGPLFEDRWTGIPVFTRRVVQSLLATDRVELDFAFDLVRIPQDLVMSAIQASTGTFLRDTYERDSADHYRLVDRTQPILYPTVNQHPGALPREAGTVHDMSTLLMPENHEAINTAFHLNRLSDELASSETVFCVSEATKAALVAAYPSVKSKTRVLYQYADWPAGFEDMDRNLPKPVMGPYAAVIGTLEPRKNLALLLSALAEPAVRDSDLRFVVIGGKGWKLDALLGELTPTDRSRILFSGFVTEFMKYRLLRHCEFLVFPSVYEGFGIPALEAMSLGKPVLASMTSSFPEVIGPAGVYFDPCSAGDYARAFEEISNAARRKELAARAVEQAATFNPPRMSREILRWLGEP